DGRVGSHCCGKRFFRSGDGGLHDGQHTRELFTRRLPGHFAKSSEAKQTWRSELEVRLDVLCGVLRESALPKCHLFPGEALQTREGGGKRFIVEIGHHILFTGSAAKAGEVTAK